MGSAGAFAPCTVKAMGHYHFLLYYLGIDFLSTYKLRYDYVRHCYTFYRNYRYDLKDIFIVVRSSAKCWRLIYTNLYDCYIIKSFKKSKLCAKFMKDLVKIG